MEGEIFGANMILTSTIERNYTIKNDPLYGQKRFRKNQMKNGDNHMNYIILSDLQTGELKNNFETTASPVTNATKSFIKFKTPHSFIEHVVGYDFSSKKPTLLEEKDYLGLSMTEKNQPADGLNFWNINKNEHSGKYNVPFKNKSQTQVVESSTPLMLSEYETPPPLPAFSYLDKTLDIESSPPEPYKFAAGTEPGKSRKSSKKHVETISEVETPPPVDKNTKVYGQWTSSKFAGSVLNYLKNIQFRTREQKKVPQTIPLTKISDSFPYSSDFKVVKVRPALQFQRRNLVEKQFETSKRSPQINVQILEEDIRNNILKTHAQTQPKHVEITSRGVRNKKQERRFYRNVESQDTNESFESTESIHTSNYELPKKRKPNTADITLQTNNLLSILPFLKSLEYFVENSQRQDMSKPEKEPDMYTKSLSTANKWHNVKSYSNDYTPREIKLDTEDGRGAIEDKIAQVNKRHPTIRLNYKHDNQKLFPYKEDKSILKGRELAMEVSNQSDYNRDSISILKYNHGFLPGHTKKTKATDKFSGTQRSKDRKIERQSDFNKNVKIGNALNERHIIGINEEQNKKSFVGGLDIIPDINKYRSDADSEGTDTAIPGSLGPRICRNLELYDRVLYVQSDESIDMTHILSPVRVKNIGIEFIVQNYKKCSLEESDLQNNAMLFIDWSKTPVRLFGGSYPKKTTDLCGFF